MLTRTPPTPTPPTRSSPAPPELPGRASIAHARRSLERQPLTPSTRSPGRSRRLASGPKRGVLMPYTVDFTNVSTVGLESSSVAPALAGLRANEARYFKNKYDHVFVVEPASNAKATIDRVHRILKEERDIEIS